MAEKDTEKDALKEAEKAAKKAKAERVKQSKPKKEGTVITRSTAAVKKFFKDFAGTCKKIVWPNGQTVIKNSLVVLATIVVIGLAVGLIDLGLTKIFDLGKTGVVALAEQLGTEDETTTGSSVLDALTTEADEKETEEADDTEETTEAETTEAEAEETTEAE